MRLLTHFPKLCFIMVLLSIVGLCVAQGDPQMLLVVGALAVISWYVTEGPRGRSLPRWVSNILVIGITLHVLFDWIQASSDVLQSLSRFALLLTLIKLYERRTPRDHSQLMLLSFLLMLIASLQSFELGFGIILLVYALLGLYVLVLYQLYAAHDQTRRERLESVPVGARIVPSTKPIIGRSPSMQFRALVFGLGVTGFGFSVIAFVAFPRGLGESTFVEISRSMARAMSGFTNEVDLLTGGRINESRREVMRVQLIDDEGNPRRTITTTTIDESGMPVRAPTSILRLKGAVMDQYDGYGRWTRSERPWHMRHVVQNEFRPVAPRRISDFPEWTMRVETLTDSRSIFTTGRVIALRSDSPQTLMFDPMTGEIRSQRDSPAVRTYELKFDMSERRYPRSSQVESSRQTWRALQRSLRNERVEELANDILAASGIPTRRLRMGSDVDESVDMPPATGAELWQWKREAAHAFERYLRTNEDFTYSLDLSHIVHTSRDGEFEEPISRFLLHHRRGQCEYFASAMAALCFNVGIESRLIAGYVAAVYDEVNRQYKVMELNAHAWVEVRIGENEWQVFDPTPPQVLNELHMPQTTRADQLRWLYDRFDVAWNRSVVRYDSHSQSQLAQRWEFGLGERAARITERIRLWVNDLHRMFRFRPATYLWLGLIGFAAILASAVVLQLLRRLMTLRQVLHLPHLHGLAYQRMLRQLGFYLDMLTVLDRAKVAKPEWQPPMQFAEQLARAHPNEADIVRRITNGFYRARYGQQPLSPDELRELRANVRTLADRFGVRL